MTKLIKQRADSLLTDDVKQKLIRICIIISCISLINTLLSSMNTTYTSFLAGVAAIILIPVTHGEVVAALKVVRNNSESLDTQDAVVGFTRFRELFTTYFLREVIETVLIFIIVMISITVFVGMNSATITTLTELLPTQTSGDTTALTAFLQNYLLSNAALASSLLLIVAIALVIAFVIDFYLFAVPYLLEQYHLTNLKAIKESFHLMKGHVWELIKLELSFLPVIILCAIIVAVINIVLESFINDTTVLSVISSFLSVLVSTYIYYPKYILSKAIFFEEIAYKQYEKENNETNI